MMDKMIAPSRSILRDLLQYLVPACLTTVVVLYIFGEDIYSLASHLLNEYAVMFGILLIVLTYLIGQIIYMMSKVFVPIFKYVLSVPFKRRLGEIDKTVKLLKDLNTKSELKIHKSFISGDQMHLYAEIAVLSRFPELHSSYIERQNNLMYFTQTLCMAAFLNTIILLLHISEDWNNLYYGIAFLALSILLFYEYLGRVKYFYERVYITFLFSENEIKE